MRPLNVTVGIAISFSFCAVAYPQHLLHVKVFNPIVVRCFGLLDFRFGPTDSLDGPDQPLAMPTEFQDLGVDHLNYINQLLDLMEATSAKISRCTCDFTRWDYDASIVSQRDPGNNRLFAHRIVKGQISYAAPDKCRFESIESWLFQNRKAEDPYVVQNEADDRERWIFDGDKTFEFDFGSKRIYEHTIPTESPKKRESNWIAPFLFGTTRQKVLDQYWLRIATPASVDGEIWLIAVPKLKSESQFISKIEIILAQETLFPKHFQLYAPGYNATTTAQSCVYEFGNPKTNDQTGENADFTKRFDCPQLPVGWELVAPYSYE